MRTLLFYAEQKEKRAAKIKSKKYRKLRKKDKERHAEPALSLEQLDEFDPEAADEERMKLERQRAEERMNLRHKKGSKWAKQLMRGEDLSEEVRCCVIH